MNKPLFIVFEGIDGSGKTTQIELLKEKLSKSNLKVDVTAEPSEGEVGNMIKKVMKRQIVLDQSTIAAMFLADRLDHINNPVKGMKKRIDEGNHVICSRYYFSNYAFQSDLVPMQWLVDCNSLCKSVLQPDFVFYLNIDPVVSFERVVKRGKQVEIYENSDKLIKTHEQYLKAFEEYGEDENIFIINGHESIDNIHNEIWKYIEKKLKIENFI